MSDEQPKLGSLFLLVFPVIFVVCWYAMSFVPNRIFITVGAILFGGIVPVMRMFMMLKKYRNHAVTDQATTSDESVDSN